MTSAITEAEPEIHTQPGTSAQQLPDDRFASGTLIKHTQSICPQCLEPVMAAVYERDGQVWMDKQCEEHGAYSALMAADSRFYYEPADQEVNDEAGAKSSCCAPTPAAASCCAPREAGNPLDNHSCNLLIEITERCNLSCPTCYAGSSPQMSKMMDIATFTAQVKQLAEQGKTGADVIQLSGGEPTVHPQLFEMIDILLAHGFPRICINSNGIKLASQDFVAKLLRSKDMALSVYLQFDGFDDNTHAALRGRADLLNLKEKALQNCLNAGVKVHPVMTLTRGINDHEVAAFMQLAMRHGAIKDVIIQPAMYSGRYDNPRRIDRLTVADTVALITEQFGVFNAQDFGPIPCSHPNCFSMAVALRTSKGLLPVSRYFPRYQSWAEEQNQALIDSVTDTINAPRAIGEIIRWAAATGQANELMSQLDDSDVERLLNRLVAWEQNPAENSIWDDLFIVSIKPFMDAYTYDQDRIDKCCVHILDPDGKPVSFCEYNAIHRPRQMARNLIPTRVV